MRIAFYTHTTQKSRIQTLGTSDRTLPSTSNTMDDVEVEFRKANKCSNYRKQLLVDICCQYATDPAWTTEPTFEQKKSHFANFTIKQLRVFVQNAVSGITPFLSAST